MTQQKYTDDNRNITDQTVNTPKLEELKHYLTRAAEIAEEVGLFLRTAEIKRVNSSICRMQGKEDDAEKLDCSITDLVDKEKVRK